MSETVLSRITEQQLHEEEFASTNFDIAGKSTLCGHYLNRSSGPLACPPRISS
ncbi:hypothetical protein ABIE00_004120 [Arthrobacter sp. OAP107]